MVINQILKNLHFQKFYITHYYYIFSYIHYIKPLATGGPSATDWSVPTGPWTPDRPQEAGVGYGGVGEDDWDPEGAEQAADDQDRRYGPNPHLAADETDPPWEGRPE